MHFLFYMYFVFCAYSFQQVSFLNSVQKPIPRTMILKLPPPPRLLTTLICRKCNDLRVLNLKVEAYSFSAERDINMHSKSKQKKNFVPKAYKCRRIIFIDPYGKHFLFQTQLVKLK